MSVQARTNPYEISQPNLGLRLPRNSSTADGAVRLISVVHKHFQSERPKPFSVQWLR